MKKKLLKIGFVMALLFANSIVMLAASTTKTPGILAGKTAVISGGTAGIGKYIATGLAKEGANIVFITHNVEGAKQFIAELQKNYGTKGDYSQCEITEEAQVVTMINEIVSKFGSIDIAVNNAGVGPHAPSNPPTGISNITEKGWDSIIDNSLKGYFFSIKHEIEQMQKQGKGVIINTALEGFNDLEANTSLYYVAKAGVEVLTKTAALENKNNGVRINMVYANEEIENKDKVGEIVAAICADSAAKITGNTINVDITK